MFVPSLMKYLSTCCSRIIPHSPSWSLFGICSQETLGGKRDGPRKVPQKFTEGAGLVAQWVELTQTGLVAQWVGLTRAGLVVQWVGLTQAGLAAQWVGLTHTPTCRVMHLGLSCDQLGQDGQHEDACQAGGQDGAPGS